MSQDFRLFDLPPELQLRIFIKYLEDAYFTVAQFSYLKALPRLALEQTCCRLCTDFRELRDMCEVLPRVPEVIQPNRTLNRAFLEDLPSGPQHQWLRKHIHILVLMRTKAPTLTQFWSEVVSGCPYLTGINASTTLQLKGDYACFQKVWQPSSTPTNARLQFCNVLWLAELAHVSSLLYEGGK